MISRRRLTPVLVAALAGAAWAGSRFSVQQLQAQQPADLGPDRIDVASYPPRQQENYKTFARACAQCHTLSRAINAPIVTRADWKRYIRREGVRSAQSSGVNLSKEDEEIILDFLAYDSNERKVRRKSEFDAATAGLESLYADVAAERLRLENERDQKKAVKPALEWNAQPEAVSEPPAPLPPEPRQ
jgi:hypothetical protein